MFHPSAFLPASFLPASWRMAIEVVPPPQTETSGGSGLRRGNRNQRRRELELYRQARRLEEDYFVVTS